MHSAGENGAMISAFPPCPKADLSTRRSRRTTVVINPGKRVGLKVLRRLHLNMAEVDRQLILENVGPVQTVLDAHDGVVNVIDTTDGIIMIGLEGGCTGCSSTPMTAMQIYYSLMKLNDVKDVVFVNGELPAYMRAFIDDKLKSEA